MTSSRQASRRRYDSTGRQAQARANRGRVLAEATRLFVDQGYAATSVAQVAAAAGVSAPTVFAHFTSKANLLKAAVDAAIVGDDAPVALHERPAMRQVHDGETAEEVLRRFAAVAVEVAARAFPIYTVAHGAADADPEIAALVRDLDAQRLAGAGTIAATVADRLGVVSVHGVGSIVGGVGVGSGVGSGGDVGAVGRIRDTVWTMFSPQVYDLLVVKRGWTAEAYQAWVVSGAVASIDAVISAGSAEETAQP